MLHDDRPASAEVVVVGGGVIGAACCHALAEAGVSATLIEAGRLGAGASGACEGNLLVSDKRPGPELDLARRSLELYPSLAERLGTDVQLERKGGLLVAQTRAAGRQLREHAETMAAAGLRVELLGPEAALEAEPVLRPDLAGAALFGEDMQLCPLRLVVGLALAAERLGARVLQGCGLERVLLEAGRVAGVRTTRGRIACRSVVLAAGVATGPIAADLGLRLPLLGRRGQILVSVPAPGLIRRKVYDFGYQATIESRGEGVEVATVLENTRRGNVLIGASREFRDSAGGSDLDVNARLAASALELAPGLGGLAILRSYAGLRPAMEDGLPAIGPAPGIEGLLLACGHEGAGIGLATGTAEMVCAMLTGVRPPVAPEAFSPHRFANAAGAGLR